MNGKLSLMEDKTTGDDFIDASRLYKPIKNDSISCSKNK